MVYLEYTHIYIGLRYLLVTNLDDSEIIYVRSFVCKITKNLYEKDEPTKGLWLQSNS